MDEQTLEKLEFGAVRELLASRCGGSLGRELARRIQPSGSRATVTRWLGQVRELRCLAETVGLPPLGGIGDIRDAIRKCGTPAGAEADALADVGGALAASGALCQWSAGLPVDAPLLANLTARAGDFRPIAEKIAEAIDERGRVRDAASAKLASIRGTIQQAQNQINIVFDRIIRLPSTTRYLQYANVTLHNDRKVLPLKAEHRGRISGIVHRSSDSGATLFVEPTEAVELNNTIVRLRVEEHKEVTRILRELSRLVHLNEREILETLQVVAVLDLLGAKLHYARDFDAVVPTLSDDRTLEFRQARHPVLESLFRRDAEAEKPVRKIVPIDVRLGEDFDLLIITGPNTGGKTVAIKTVGLLVLMAQAGIPIPAASGSRLPVYRNVFVDIGDEQSIEQSLSTFSSHLSNILDILRRAGEQSLVLIDELGAGTDPDEGAAIGRSIMEELLHIGAVAAITTHLSALKAVAYTQDRVDNASVEFDAETLKPAYRLRIGEPGNSNALVIARRLGMPKALIQRARSHLDNRAQALTHAIAGTLASRRKAERARADAQQAQRDAERERSHLEARAKALEEARQEHDRWSTWVGGLRAGDEVFVRSFDRNGRIVRMRLQQQTAVVNTGAVDLEVPLNELSPPNGSS